MQRECQHQLSWKPLVVKEGREERSFASGKQMWFDWSQEAIRAVVVPTVGTAGWSQ